MAGSPATLLAASDLGFVLPDGRVVFEALSVALASERTGLVGANGIGKSILVRILAGALAPSSGHVTRSGRVAYLPQERAGRWGRAVDERGRAARLDGSSGSHTVAEALAVDDVLRALERIEAGGTDTVDFDVVGSDWDLRDQIGRVLDRFGLGHVDLSRPVASLSGGEATRTALVGLVLRQPDLVILDEPTNDLDRESRASLHAWIEEWDRGMLVVSHDRGVLRRVDRVLELGARGLRAYGGGYDLYRERKTVEEDAVQRDLEDARKELRKVERDAQRQRERQDRRTARGRKGRLAGGVPKVLLGARKESGEATSGRLGKTGQRRAARGRERLEEARSAVEERVRIDVNLGRSGVHASLRVLEMRGVSYAHAATGPVLQRIDLVVSGPERIAVVGPNGAGKTTLLRLVAGEISPSVGHIGLGVPAAAVAYLDQRAAGLGTQRSVLDAFRAANPALGPTESRHVLARYLFRGDAALARVEHLSGGERIRAALACTVGAERPPALLLLDEPTNHLDLESLEAVEDVLRGFDGALLVVSHDDAFLEAIGTEREVRLTGMRRGG